MSNSFVLRADERGYNKILSTGSTAAYVGGHPDAFITRFSSFNFREYQEGRPGFGRIRVFGDEAFHHPGCSYSMHRTTTSSSARSCWRESSRTSTRWAASRSWARATITHSPPVPAGCMKSSTAMPNRCGPSISGCCRTNFCCRRPTRAAISTPLPA